MVHGIHTAELCTKVVRSAHTDTQLGYVDSISDFPKVSMHLPSTELGPRYENAQQYEFNLLEELHHALAHGWAEAYPRALGFERLGPELGVTCLRWNVVSRSAPSVRDWTKRYVFFFFAPCIGLAGVGTPASLGSKGSPRLCRRARRPEAPASGRPTAPRPGSLSFHRVFRAFWFGPVFRACGLVFYGVN